MTTYTIELNEREDLALEYETERRAAVPVPAPPGTPQPPPLTPDAVLQLLVRQSLGPMLSTVEGVVEPLLQMARDTSLGHREALLAALPSTSLAKYLTWRLRQEESGWTRP